MTKIETILCGAEVAWRGEPLTEAQSDALIEALQSIDADDMPLLGVATVRALLARVMAHTQAQREVCLIQLAVARGEEPSGRTDH